ncbi:MULTISPECIES: ROK family protein [unclassified Vibrio]|uniref:ROK family protein n=1 Tax=Vibrio sp. HB236076 TaxID=3232307 RepID=A0AB39HDL1_9VIBR|nr:ROK family protein [Vibrio sp. HB161653]MDP5253682.1 ROK family protein [Vibrio sp. HB161653]
MYMAQPGHIDQIKQNNAGRVYRLIDQHGPISRIDLSKQSSLAPASITKITRELIEGHLVEEIALGVAVGRGRPAIGLRVKHQGWQFLSLRLNQNVLYLALHELGGDLLIEHRVNLTCVDQEGFLDALLTEIQRFLQMYQSVVDRLTSIAITLPGSVDPNSGRVLSMPSFQVSNLELGKAVYQAIGLPVFVGNDVRSWALAEQMYGHSSKSHNMALVDFQDDVSAGVIVNDALLHGAQGNIGELAHIQIDPNGELCTCGNRGCLNTLASVESLKRFLQQELNQGKKSILRLTPQLTIADICQAANNGDKLAFAGIAHLAKHLSKAIAIIVNLFNPEKVLLAGEINQASLILYPMLIEEIKKQTPKTHHQELVLEAAYLSHTTTLPGAALVKQAMYDGELLMKVIEG